MGLTARPRDAVHLKNYIFLNTNKTTIGFLKYTKINELTLRNCKNMTPCIFLIVIYG